MKFRPLALPLLPIGFFALAAPSAHAASYAISSIGKTELVGSTSSVPSGGETANFSSGSVTVGTTFAKFQLVLSGTTTRVADMRVTVVGVRGTLDTTGGKSGLMIAQTTNSQGLTDSGTMSILSAFSAAGTGGESSLTLRFSFFEPDTAVAKNLGLELTSFDFDYRQFMRVSNTDFTAEAHGSKLTKTSSGGNTTFSDLGNSDATFTQATNAVVLNNVVDSSFDITVGKVGTGNSLFMFEFRDPSQILDSPLNPVAIPEPSSALALATGAIGLAFLRRRAK